ncbi:MAG TPA: BTAD domain-containing putative transcriptional regulator, partial [Gemmatimonadaceae bacterium]|nr:BTAD domain-containing putative transcriptional regulator [Gemmatimonadaceae bacterium]
YTVRQHLPPGAIASRGDDELSASPAIIRTDVADMIDDLNAGRFLEALDRYQGELLPGIYIADAPAFEKWLEGERSRMRSMARRAAIQLSEELEKRGDLINAIEAARRASEFDAADEAAARRWIALLDKSGDRAQAFAVYERFRNHVFEAFGVRPSAETVALLDSVRTRRDVPQPVQPTQPGTDVAPAPLVAATPIAPAPEIQRTSSSLVSVRAKWLLLAVPVAAVVIAWIGFRPDSNPAPAALSRSLIVLPVENETGDPKLSYVATGIAEDVARRLEGIGGITIRSGARSDWTEKTRHDIQTIGREFGSKILLRTSLRKVGDSLEMNASVIDATTSEERALAPRRFVTGGIRDVESILAADVAGAVFRTGIPASPRESDRQVDPESYRLTLEGWQQLLSSQKTAAPAPPPRSGSTKAPTRANLAGELFQKAVTIDPLNARAWSGLASTWSTRTTSDNIPFDEGYERSTAAALRALALDSLQGTAWADLAILRALKYRDLSVGLELIRRAERADPSNPEIFLIKSTLFRSAHQYDKARDAIRVARQLDPLTPTYLEREASIEFCADRPENALRLFRSELTMKPSDRLAQEGLIRALALAGRYDEAIAAWQIQAASDGDGELAKLLASARGSDAYWSIKHTLGKRRLAALQKETDRVSPLALMQASFAAGDSAAGFRALDKAYSAEVRALYRLSCMPDVDEFRHTPHFVAALAKIGSLRVR